MGQLSYAKTVCINQIVEHPSLDRTVLGIKNSIIKEHVIYLNAQNNAALNLQNAQKCYGEKADVNVGVATLSAQSFLSQLKRFETPLVFTSVTDPKSAGLTDNLLITGVSNFIPQEDQLIFFKQVDPKIQTIGVVYNLSEINSKILNEKLSKIAPTQNFKVLLKGVARSADIKAALDELLPKVDAIFINNDNMLLSALPLVSYEALKYKKYLFVSDVDVVEKGAIAALGPDQYELGLQTGNMINAILNGKKPSEIAIETPQKITIMINCPIANKLNKKINAKHFNSPLNFIKGDRSCLTTNG